MPIVKRLLDRQVSLLEYLTSGRAIFGESGGGALDPALRGLDPGLLRVEARFSHHKRMAKIGQVFPKTFELLADDTNKLVREFVETSPPFDIGRVENARQFHEFLLERWRHNVPQPPYVCDVAACELALATTRGAQDDGTPARDEEHAPRGSVRRHPGVSLFRCAYDVRPIFDDGFALAVPARRETLIALALAPDGEQPHILELAPEVFDLLAAAEQWIEPHAFDEFPEADRLLADLTAAGLLEVCR